jgi:hypothetical protein
LPGTEKPDGNVLRAFWKEKEEVEDLDKQVKINYEIKKLLFYFSGAFYIVLNIVWKENISL